MLAPEGTCLVSSALWRTNEGRFSFATRCDWWYQFSMKTHWRRPLSQRPWMMHKLCHAVICSDLDFCNGPRNHQQNVPKCAAENGEHVSHFPPPCTATRDDLNWFMLKLLDYSRSHALIWVSTWIWVFTNLNKKQLSLKNVFYTKHLEL